MNFISLLGNVQTCIPQGVKAIKCRSNYKVEPSADIPCEIFISTLNGHFILIIIMFGISSEIVTILNRVLSVWISMGLFS